QQAEAHGTQPAPKSRMAVVWAALIVGAILLILLLVFVIQNNVSTEFEYFTWHFNLPLGVAMLLAAIAGALIMALAGSVRMIQMRWELHKLRRNQK
ncbi:MAG: lipopolysaccharide assembly protein LapA domain-containing protein, partial [Dermabacter sp.]|nr:lipopolysaccharide assembly protein LapA domain-containing protein [Dermabacter sp.]